MEIRPSDKKSIQGGMHEPMYLGMNRSKEQFKKLVIRKDKADWLISVALKRRWTDSNAHSKTAY